VTLARARLAKGRVNIACNLLVRSGDVQDADQLRSAWRPLELVTVFGRAAHVASMRNSSHDDYPPEVASIRSKWEV